LGLPFKQIAHARLLGVMLHDAIHLLMGHLTVFESECDIVRDCRTDELVIGVLKDDA
jgi:hypothetical protein